MVAFRTDAHFAFAGRSSASVASSFLLAASCFPLTYLHRSFLNFFLVLGRLLDRDPCLAQFYLARKFFSRQV